MQSRTEILSRLVKGLPSVKGGKVHTNIAFEAAGVQVPAALFIDVSPFQALSRIAVF